jgi:hypothetical protein
MSGRVYEAQKRLKSLEKTDSADSRRQLTSLGIICAIMLTKN